MKTYRTLIALVSLVLALPALGRRGPSNDGDVDLKSGFAAYFGVNDPYPSLLSVGISYDLAPFSRLVLGIGATDTSGDSIPITVGVGVRFFVPTLRVTPIFGLNFSSNVETRHYYSYDPYNDTTGSTRYGYATATTGVAWSAGKLLRFEGGLQWGLVPRTSRYDRRYEILPYFTIGFRL